MESPLDRNPKLLINSRAHFYTIENALGGGNNINFTAPHFEDAARDQQQQQKFLIQQPIIVENDGVRHKDFSLFSSSLPPVATSDFLKIDSSGSQTIHTTVPNRDDKSSNTRHQDLKKISDESFLNAHEKEKSAGVRDVVSENVLTPMHVGIVLMNNEDELANSAVVSEENPTPVEQIVDNHLSSNSGKDDALTDEFIPKVGPHNVKTESDFVPSALLSQKLIQQPIGRPLSFADTVQITNPPKRPVKSQSPMAILFNDLFNFDDIINLLTGRSNQPTAQQQQQLQQQTQQYQQHQSNGYATYNKLASSSSNINAVKKPFYTKYLYPSTASAVVRQTRMPKYATIPASEYQKFGFSGKWIRLNMFRK